MKLPLSTQPHPYIQNIIMRYTRSGGVECQEFPRQIIFEFDESVKIHDIGVEMRLAGSNGIPITPTGSITATVYIQYRRSDAVLAPVTGGSIDPVGNVLSQNRLEFSNYASFPLRTYTRDAGADLGVMQGAFLEGSAAAASEAVVHEKFPEVLPAHSRILFDLVDQRNSEQDGEELVRATVAVVASSGGGGMY